MVLSVKGGRPVVTSGSMAVFDTWPPHNVAGRLIVIELGNRPEMTEVWLASLVGGCVTNDADEAVDRAQLIGRTNGGIEQGG
jgi:hypothetical protein